MAFAAWLPLLTGQPWGPQRDAALRAGQTVHLDAGRRLLALTTSLTNADLSTPLYLLDDLSLFPGIAAADSRYPALPLEAFLPLLNSPPVVLLFDHAAAPTYSLHEHVCC